MIGTRLPLLQSARLAAKSRQKAGIIGALIVVAAASVTGLAHAQGRANAASITVDLPPATSPTIVDETRIAQGLEMRALGGPARIINAALPFSGGEVTSAEPFIISGSDTDKLLALRCLSQAVYYEAGSEPLEGRRAVAQVVLNRVRHPAFPKSVCGVVYQGAGSGTCQFSFVCQGKLSRPPSLDAWRDAQAIARAALSGYVTDKVGEATHYHADYVAPQWAPLLSKIAAIGQHIFYRWPGEWGEAQMFNGRYAGEPRDALTLRLAGSSGELGIKGADEAPAKIIVSRVQYHIAALLEPSSNPAPPAGTTISSLVSKGLSDRTVAMAQ